MIEPRCLVRAFVALSLAVLLPACGGDSAKSGGASARSHPPAVVESMNRAVGLMGKFEFEQAAAAFAALAKEPQAPAEATLNLAIATLNQSREGAQEDALVRLREFVKSDPPKDLAVRARYCMALCELYLGRAAEAVPHFVEIADSKGADAYAQYFAGQSLEQVGEYAKALGWYERAAERDPALKSALLGVQRCARKSGDEARADRALAAFEKLASNPRARNAEFKYTRMGDLGLAVVLDDAVRAPYAPKAGPVFLDPKPIALAGSAEIRWSNDISQHAATVDLDGDGLLDLVLARASMMKNAGGAIEARTLVLHARSDRSFEPQPDHPLSSIAGGGVNSILFGDIDGNGRVDAYFCRSGGNVLALQDGQGGFRDATGEWKAAGRGALCNDGALADLDHDGDLDLVLLYREGPNDILANLGNGEFRSIGEQAGLGSEERAPRSVIVGDFDHDRDADILIVNETLPHQLLLNERMWKWTDGTAPGVSRAQLDDTATAAAVVELADLPLRRAVFATGAYLRLPSRIERIKPNQGIELGVADVSGDGHQDILAFGVDRISMYDESARLVQEFAIPEGAIRTQLAMLEPIRGAHLITLRNGAPPLLWEPGPARGPFAALSFSGRTDPSQSMRSNASGIGTGYAARVGSEWFGGETFRAHTGRGQSLAPVAVGTGPFGKIDMLEIDWSDGVFQSEIDLASNAQHAIAETQRQISSCPVLFAWNGREQRFVSDVLGIGGVGFLLEPGVYSEPRPRETFVLPGGALAPKPDGTLAISLAEPMEESCVLDGARLFAYDLPAGWDIAPDERLAIGGAAPTGDIIAWSTEYPVLGNATLEKADLLALDVGATDPRFIGRLAGEQVVELAFGTAIDALPDPWLVLDGWIEYPYCQTMFAAWQAGAKYRAPSLEARASDGSWTELVAEWGYPAGMPRRLALPVPREKLPVGCTALRMRTNMEVYFDSARLISREALPQQPVECALKAARLSSPGFARRSTGPQKQPFYDRNAMRPLWDCRFQRGLYTEFGEVRGLLEHQDGAPVIFGPGEEVAIEFASPAPPAAGMTRRYVLDVRGWCKDMDLYTRDGESIEPLPVKPADAAAAELLRKSRTRPAGGR